MSKDKEFGLYKLNAHYGRMGDLTGLFIAKKSHVKKLIESKIEVYFGEVLGKHSEVYGSLDEKEIKLISDDKKVMEVVSEFDLETGLNPFHYTVLNVEEEFEDMTTEEVVEVLIERENQKP